jgi:GAG-pre-integrase domain
MNNLYWLTSAKLELPSERFSAAKDSERDEIRKWHNRLVHLKKDKILQMMRSNQFVPEKEADKPCLDCVSGK